MNGFYRKGGTNTLWRGLGFDSDGSTPSVAVSPSPTPVVGQVRGRRVAGVTFFTASNSSSGSATPWLSGTDWVAATGWVVVAEVPPPEWSLTTSAIRCDSRPLDQ